MTPRGAFLGPIGPMRRVIEEVASVAGITPDDITGPCRQQNHVRARQMAMLICRDYCNASFPEIGRAFNRHHTTVMHSVDVASERCIDADWDDMEAIARLAGLVRDTAA